MCVVGEPEGGVSYDCVTKHPCSVFVQQPASHSPVAAIVPMLQAVLALRRAYDLQDVQRELRERLGVRHHRLLRLRHARLLCLSSSLVAVCCARLIVAWGKRKVVCAGAPLSVVINHWFLRLMLCQLCAGSCWLCVDRGGALSTGKCRTRAAAATATPAPAACRLDSTAPPHPALLPCAINQGVRALNRTPPNTTRRASSSSGHEFYCWRGAHSLAQKNRGQGRARERVNSRGKGVGDGVEERGGEGRACVCAHQEG